MPLRVPPSTPQGPPHCRQPKGIPASHLQSASQTQIAWSSGSEWEERGREGEEGRSRRGKEEGGGRGWIEEGKVGSVEGGEGERVEDRKGKRRESGVKYEWREGKREGMRIL